MKGFVAWYDFAKAIFEISDSQTLVNPIETVQYPTPAKRPEVSVLNKKKIKTAYGLKIEGLVFIIKKNY
jgi:dTDP-4-dehydrorhamnose reductase